MPNPDVSSGQTISWQVKIGLHFLSIKRTDKLMVSSKGTVVEESGVAAGVHKDVVRVDVAVADAVRVQILQRARHAQRDAGHEGGAEGAVSRPAAAQQRLQVGLGRQRLSPDPLQHQRMRLLQLCQHPAHAHRLPGTPAL